MSVNADKLVQIVPRIISGGTTGLTFAGLVLTQNDLIPAGRVMQFATAQAVGAFFGMSAAEYLQAAVPYFQGPANNLTIPQKIYFARYNATAVAGWVRGSAYTGTLTQLQDVTQGNLTFTVDGVQVQATGIDLSAATSYSAVAAALQTALGASVSVTYSSQTQAFQITSATTGAASSVSYEAGSDLGVLLGLTEQAGAVISEGMAAQTLPECMANVLLYARDWVTFTSVWEPDTAEKLALAAWQATYDTRFCYVMWDTDANILRNNQQSAGAQLMELNTPGVCPVFNSLQFAAFVMGFAASLNFDTLNGRSTLAYKQFEGQPPTVTNDEDYDQALANGYNVYADFATASANYKFAQPGQVTGVWDWLDTYLDAVAIKDGLQLNLLDLLKGVNSLPYNQDGYSAIRTACLDTIEKYKKFGAIRAGVTLSNTQRVQLVQEVGQDVSKTLFSEGWYMQVLDPGATVRAARGTPDCKFYYMDGGSIQRIVLPSTAIQ